METIKVKFLGIPSITIGNVRVDFPFSKADSIIYLLLYEKIVSREMLSSLLWRDMDEQSAKKNLRNAIYIIRKHTFDDIIISPKRSILQLNDKYKILSDVDLIKDFDTCDSNNLNQILECYDGNFLEELKLKSNPEFVEWIETISVKLRNTYINKLKRLSDRLILEKEYFNAELCCRKLIELEEYEEIGYSNLMKLFMYQHKYENAIIIYHDLVKKLDDDLSVKPSMETESVYEEVINSIKIKTDRNSVNFYGRENEKKILYDNIYNFIGNKSFNSFLICGEDGIGKSLLLDEIINDFDINILMIKVNCYEYDTGFIFKFWDKVFQQISISIRENKLNIPRSLINNISKSFPTLDIDSSDNTEDYYNTSNYNLTEMAIFDLFSFLSNKLKIIFVVDDLHFIDKASLELLFKTILANRFKIMLIATSRDENENIDDKFYYSLKYNNAIKKIYLSRFNKSDTTRFVELVMPEALYKIDLIYSESEGNPLFIIEMINSIKNGIEESCMTNKIENLIKCRLINLSHQANKLLSICSLFHDIFYMEMLTKITDIKSIDLIDIIDELLSKDILKEELDRNKKLGFTFTHRKIREYIYNNVSNSKRIILHEKVAEYYESQLRNDKKYDRSIYPEMIYHFALSNNKIKLFKYKIKLLHYILNARHEIFPVAEVNEAVGFIQYYLDGESLEKEFKEIRSLYEELLCCQNDKLIEEEIIYLYLYGRYNKNRGNQAEALLCLNKMVSVAENNNYVGYALNGYLQLIHYYVNINDVSLMSKIIEKAENTAKLLEDKCKMAIVWRFKGYSFILTGRYNDGENYIYKALDIFNSSPNREKYILNMVASLFYLGESYRIQESYEKALDYYNQAIDLCDENEEFPAVALIFSKIGYIKYNQNNIDEAQFYFLKSLKAYEKSIFAWGRAEVYYYLYKIYEYKKGMVKAKHYLEEALKYVDIYSSGDLRDTIYNILDTL